MRFFSIKTILPVMILALLVLTPEITHANFLKETLWNAFTGLFGLILVLCGNLLDFAINRFVIGFATEYTTSIGVAVDAGWALVRDVMNILFIFGLLYIGFKILLGTDDSRTKSMIANLVIAALLVNFSLFFTKFVVDISNSLASEIAINGFAQNPNANTTTVGGQNTSGQTVSTQFYQVDMSTTLMVLLGVTTIFDSGDTPTFADGNGRNEEWGYIFGTALMLIIASFTFAVGAILLIIRFISLNFYMLFSPFMFIGWAFPPLAKYTGDYWRGFLGKAFFAPVYFLLMYFSFQIVSTLSTSRNVASFGDTSYGNSFLGGAVGPDSSFPFFVVAIGALLFSVFAAQKMGADGASTAVSVGKSGLNKVQRTVKRGAIGTGKFAASQTAGRAARRVSYEAGRTGRKALGNLQQIKGDGVIARTARGAARSRVAENTIGAAADRTMRTKFGLSQTINEDKQQKADLQRKFNRSEKESARGAQLRDAYLGTEEALEKLDTVAVGNQTEIKGELRSFSSQDDIDSLRAELVADRDREIAAAIGKMSDDEIKGLLSDQQFIDKIGGNFTKGNIFKEPAVAKHLKDSQIKALAESGLLTNTDTEEIEAAWGKGNIDDVLETQENATATTKQLEDSIKTLSDNIRSMSKERLASLKPETLSKEGVAVHLKKTDLDNLKESGKFSVEQLRSIENARNSALTKIVKEGTYVSKSASQAANDPAFQESQRENLFKASTKDIGNYPVAIFKESAAFEHVTPQMIEERMKNGVTKKDIQEMQDAYLKSNATNNSAWNKWENGNSTHAAQFFN